MEDAFKHVTFAINNLLKEDSENLENNSLYGGESN